MKTRIFYRLKPNPSFGDQDFDTLEEAIQGRLEFGGIGTPSGKRMKEDSKKYWQKQMRECKILKVTQTIEEVTPPLEIAAFETWGDDGISALYLASVDGINRVAKFIEDSNGSIATLHVFDNETEASEAYFEQRMSRDAD